MTTATYNTRIYLSAVVVGDPQIAVCVNGHAVRDARYVIRLEVVKRAAIRCVIT